MNNYINHVQLVGHLGQDPEIITIAGGTSLVKVSIATNEPYKDKNGDFQNNTQWHNLVAWGKLGERMSTKLSKGNYVLVTGKIENKTWEAKDGSKRKGTDIRVQAYLHLDKKRVEQAVEMAQ